jgi:osmotically-inducible protein OsmY
MSDNKRLQQAVITELRWEPSVTATDIGVTADKGVVTLSGHVQNFAEKRAAEAAAGRVNGVKAVADEIEVRLPSDLKLADDEIAAAALDRLKWDVAVPHHNIKVNVEHGWVTLSGQVDWHFQKEDAARDIQRLIGVVGVSNEITIKARVNVAEINDEITHALHRSWFFDPQTVRVSAEGSKVRLDGTVHNMHERQQAAATAWSAPGVTDVENRLEIK